MVCFDTPTKDKKMCDTCHKVLVDVVKLFKVVACSEKVKKISKDPSIKATHTSIMTFINYKFRTC